MLCDMNCGYGAKSFALEMKCSPCDLNCPCDAQPHANVPDMAAPFPKAAARSFPLALLFPESPSWKQSRAPASLFAIERYSWSSKNRKLLPCEIIWGCGDADWELLDRYDGPAGVAAGTPEAERRPTGRLPPYLLREWQPDLQRKQICDRTNTRNTHDRRTHNGRKGPSSYSTKAKGCTSSCLLSAETRGGMTTIMQVLC
jgi:hypothetical protein